MRALEWGLSLTLAVGTVPPSLQPPGAFHGGEAVARDGESWLALRVVGDEAALVPTRLRVRTVFDELVDKAGGEETGQSVEAPLTDVLMYVRGDALSAGPIHFVRIDQSGEGRLPADVQFAGRTYRLSTSCSPGGVSEGQQELACEVRLAQGGRHQSLVRMAGYREGNTDVLGDDATPHLLFVGDLDRDGNLDLILDTTDHYNVSRPTLFLSSSASKGEMVHEVAQHVSVGC